MFFRVRILGGLRDHILAILADHFGHFWGTVFVSIFGKFSGSSKCQSRAGVEGDLGVSGGLLASTTVANQLVC